MTAVTTTTITSTTSSPTRADVAPLAVIADGITSRVRGRTIIEDISLDVRVGTLVAIAGGSGSGKTTLIEVLAGLHRPTAGVVVAGPGHIPATHLAGTGHVGFVPQEDIIHRDLPLRRTLLHAARLRLPVGVAAEARVEQVVIRLGLADCADVVVGDLSGGQRKRASIAVELLTDPSAIYLDEPTSGLDPTSCAEVLAVLRRVADRGVAVVMTTHHPSEIEACDHVVFLTDSGRLAFDGTPAAAVDHFGVRDVAAIYPVLIGAAGAAWTRRWSVGAAPRRRLAPSEVPRRRGTAVVEARPGAVRQWCVLTRRSAEVILGSRLTLAIVFGSPAVVITMMAMLFPSGRTLLPQVSFWAVFAAFFFGVTDGLQQIVSERAVTARDWFSGMRLSAYLASKVALLLPVLVLMSATMLLVLRLFDRLPGVRTTTIAALFGTMCLTAAAGLAVGLAASAAVGDVAQAMLALPMICFPQVLFSGAVVPLGRMTVVGRLVSVAMATRWGFDSFCRSLGLGGESIGSWTDGWWALMACIGVSLASAGWFLRRAVASHRR